MNLPLIFKIPNKIKKKTKEPRFVAQEKSKLNPPPYLSYVTESGKVTNRMFIKHVAKTCMSINLFRILIPCVTRNLLHQISSQTRLDLHLQFNSTKT